jgi:hypothetical protein
MMLFGNSNKIGWFVSLLVCPSPTKFERLKELFWVHGSGLFEICVIPPKEHGYVISSINLLSVFLKK